jgi:hypothetical protein
MIVCRNSLAYSSQQLAYIVASLEQMATGLPVEGVLQVCHASYYFCSFCDHTGVYKYVLSVLICVYMREYMYITF